jgi:hypothetical protein
MSGQQSKSKGSAFERSICEALSLWITKGAKKDCFWRSAMSGGRSTRGMAKGQTLSRQAGDISAVSPEGHALTDRYYIELKFYADLALERFFVRQAGLLAGFWLKTCSEATKHGREPMLIVKQNRIPAMLITHVGQVDGMTTMRRYRSTSYIHLKGYLRCEVYLLDDVLQREFTGGK